MSKLSPLRVLVAVAPSGGEIRLIKYSEEDKELSFYHGCLEAIEDTAFWRAKLRAEKGGIDNWEKATELLREHGWRTEP